MRFWLEIVLIALLLPFVMFGVVISVLGVLTVLGVRSELAHDIAIVTFPLPLLLTLRLLYACSVTGERPFHLFRRLLAGLWKRG